LLTAALAAAAAGQSPSGPAWTRGAVCYEIFVRSFFDSDGDGIGDLNGLIRKLGYVDSLGASCIWLMPVAQSPSYHGYDVSDYYRVAPAYGTNADFKRLVAEAHRRRIKVLVDMVLNHTSNENPWFQAGLKDTTSPYRSWYRFSPTALGKGPWGAEAWHHSPVRDEYYYGVFWSGMPDLNYETPAVQQEAMKIATFWLREMGADGFRLDAVPYLLEEGSCLAGCPGTHAFLRAYAAHIRGVKPDAYTVGEVWGSIDQTLPYYPDQLTSYFGFELACNAVTQCATAGAWFDVFDLQLEANEYQTPNIYAGPGSGAAHLWYQGGKWIRGVFPLDLRGTDPSGVCRMLVSWNGQVVQDSGERPTNGGFWDQCDPNHVPNSPQDFFGGATVDTRTTVPASARGVQLALQAHNASYTPASGAPDWSSDVEYLNVDNQPVGLSLTGPAQASVAGGTQHVTATATAGPSGVGSIVCSVDRASWTGERLTAAGGGTATAEVPVSGLGQHQVSCYATNQSVDSSGHPAASATQSWSLKIAKPVGAGITFAQLIRHCSRELRRVHTRAGIRRKWVKVCTTQTVPHHVAHVAYGRGVIVHGWLTSSDGIPIGNAPVRILAAPDNGSGAWHAAAVVITSADGSWQATLHPGPSRLIQATYAGGPDTEAASSAVVKMIVPAKVVLAHVTRNVPWGAVLVIRGRLLGGDIPHEQILQLRSGVGRHLQVIGNPYIRRDGQFVIRLAATGSGGPLRTQIAVTTLKETNYPYARGASPRVWVTIG